ncbi:MAG: TerB N-terminal domain-containing protein [Oscillospiraceae bacterium]|nr:TerB N-terminal domain-containing protein [Oscillospiraceae bacterium]
MDTNRKKNAANWYNKIYRDETIRPRARSAAPELPSLLRTARSLENSPDHPWQSRESVFLKQGKLLANYEDDQPYRGDPVHYYPTYQSLSDAELRGYFTWRTQLRRGVPQRTSLSFAFLYIYELLNQIGVTDPMDGYNRLLWFRDSYGALDDRILPYLVRWVPDYVVYYSLDPNLLAASPQVLFDRSITVLDNIAEQDEAKVMFALKQLAPKWLGRSRFYAARQADCDRVIVRVLRRVSAHYAARCKRSMVEQYFGKHDRVQTRVFESAVFCDPLKIRNREYALDERCTYRCKDGLWCIERYAGPPRPSFKLEGVLKTIDAVMREECGDKHPVKYAMDTKWLIALIREETRALLAEQQAAEAKKLTIDYASLARIRADAAITRDKLTVDEEPEETVLPEQPPAPPVERTARDDCPALPLTPPQYRLLRCLLYGGSLDWVRQEGHLLSVLADGINEALYDTFLDAVLDDSPAPIDDYIDDLKEMIQP